MRPSMIPATLMILMASTSFASAAATQQEADAIKASVEKYIGSTPGVITVTPNGDVYDFVFDPKPLAASVNDKTFSFDSTPIKAALKPLGAGKWAYEHDAPWSLTVKKGTETVFDYKIAGFKQSGIWDEAIGAPAESKFEATNYTVEQNVLDPRMNTQNQTSAKIASMSGGMKGTAAATGGADLSADYSVKDYTSQVKLTGPDKTELMSFAYKVQSATSANQSSGLKLKEMLGLLAWGVAHPSLELAKQDQQTFKTLLTAAMPLFNSIKADISASDVKINTKIGDSDLKEATAIVDMNGAVKDGKFREAFGFKGLKLPASLLPAWAVKLVPSESGFDFAASGFDGEAAAKWAIENLDLNKDPPFPADSGPAFLAKAAPQGTIIVTLNPTFVASSLYRVDASGDMKVNINGQPPTGSATVTMTGFDATLKALQDAAASDPKVQQAMGGLLAAKGFAKTEGDKLLWKLELGAGGEFKINGVNLGKM